MPPNRHFLLLQGPHGPFFRLLGGMLRAAGAEVHRVGFNGGDAAFWRGKGYLPFRDSIESWPDALATILADKKITDIVLYGDTRPVHAEAVRQAKAKGLHIHVFEEGYLRPYWVTYERGGSNGHSALMQIDMAQIRCLQSKRGADLPVPPASWGDMRQHILYGAVYHWHVLMRKAHYPEFRTHRALPILTEASLYTKALLLMPLRKIKRGRDTRALLASGHPFHVVLLQLEHDSSFRAHSNFPDMSAFVSEVIDGFVEGAPKHHHLVFKAHPLENDQAQLRKVVTAKATAAGIADRVHYHRGGKLARLLDAATSAVTVNSTAAQQALWRGLPVKTFGAAIYNKPAFVSDQPLAAFFSAPKRPDLSAYRDFRDFLLMTSQIPGGYYSQKGRQQVLRQIVDKMLAPHDPYQTALARLPIE